MANLQDPLDDIDIPGLDLGRLSRHLWDHGMTLDRTAGPRRFSAGYGNMNFLVIVNGTPMVLRRPPLGPVPPGANDMAREFRILAHLNPVLPLVPRAYFFCDEPEVIGAPFLLMEYRPGLVIGAEIDAETSATWTKEDPIGQTIGSTMTDVLADLHTVDAAACGLGGLGRPDGFLERTLKGWANRAHLCWTDRTPDDLVPLLDWLQAHLPAETASPTLIHNDFKLDNIILDPSTLEPRALIDWDMGTRGDPLFDLAILLSYWTEEADPEAMHLMRQMPTAAHGFPTRSEAAALYAMRSGRDLGEFTFYRVLATLRVAVVFRQLFQRYQSGRTDDPAFRGFDDLSHGLLRFGLDLTRDRYF